MSRRPIAEVTLQAPGTKGPLIGAGQVIYFIGAVAQFVLNHHPTAIRFKESASTHFSSWLEGSTNTKDLCTLIKKDLRKGRSRKGIRRVHKSPGRRAR